MKVGIYIDADNISYKDCMEIEQYAQSNGDVIVKKIFGDWTKPEMNKWQKVVFDHGYEPIQVFRKNQKNSTDICMITDMIFDATTMTYLGHIIIASCDSDFSYACIKLRTLNLKTTAISYGHTLLSNYTTSFYFLKSEKDSPKSQDLETKSPVADIMEFKKIIKFAKLSKTEKKAIPANNIIKYKNRKYVINSDIVNKNVKKIKKNKKKYIEKNQEIFNVIPFDFFVEQLENRI